MSKCFDDAWVAVHIRLKQTGLNLRISYDRNLRNTDEGSPTLAIGDHAIKRAPLFRGPPASA